MTLFPDSYIDLNTPFPATHHLALGHVVGVVKGVAAGVVKDGDGRRLRAEESGDVEGRRDVVRGRE